MVVLVARPFIMPMRLNESATAYVAASRWSDGRMVDAQLNARKSRYLQGCNGVRQEADEEYVVIIYQMMFERRLTVG